MKVSVRLISKLEEMKKVEDNWDKLIRENSETPFLFSGFANQLFESINMPNIIPTFLIISVDDEIIGIAPVGIVDAGARFCRFVPKDYQPDVICKNNYRELCLKYTVDLLFNKLQCQFVDFSLQPNSPNINVLKKVCRQLGIQFLMTAEAGHSILRVSGNWTDFEKSLGRKYKKLVRKIERRMNSVGSWRISFFGRGKSEPRIFDKILKIERNSWKWAFRKQTGRVIDPSLAFFWNGARKTALKESAFDWNVAVLELEDIGIAYSLFTKYKHSAYTCKTSFNERYRNMYPGIYVKHAVIRELFGESEIKEVDFMSDMPFHRKWTKEPIPNVRFHMFKKSLVPIFINYSHSNKFFRTGLAALSLVSRKAKLAYSALYY